MSGLEEKPVSRQRRWQIARVKTGGCALCPSQAHRRGLCADHIAKQAAYKKRRNAELIAAGLCRSCGRKASGTWVGFCKKCQRLAKASHAAWKARRPRATTRVDGMNVCSVCGKRGHNSLRHKVAS